MSDVILTREERQNRIEELRQWFKDHDEEYRDQELPPEVRSAWDQNQAELNDHEKTISDLEKRDAQMRELIKDPKNTETSRSWEGGHRSPQLISRMQEREVYDLSEMRVNPFSPMASTPELIQRARRAAEISYFPAAGRDQERAQAHVDQLLRRGDDEDWETGEVARRILATGSPAYKRAFAKQVSAAMRGAPGSAALTVDEQRAVERALAVGVGSTGGFAVPFQLDNTIVPTSNSSVNPYRAACRVVNISGTNEWRGVTSAGITANYGYQAEAAAAVEATGPVLAQPAFIVKRATAFLPVSIEITQDWSALQSELGTMIQDAKDDLEAVQFTTGVGTTVFPQGILVGATTSLNAGSGLTMVVNDLYNTEVALPPRFRPRAQWIANRFVYNKVRQFDTAGGASLWVDNLRAGINSGVPTPGNTGYDLIGYPANEASAFPATFSPTGTVIALLGDLRYYVIVDRIGMDVEVIPHIFDGSTGFPKGQRGLYAFWRNFAAVIDPNAFRVLKSLT